MKTNELVFKTKSLMLTFVLSIVSSIILAGGKNDNNLNHLSINLDNTEVLISYLNASENDCQNNAALIELSKNMMVNGVHVNKGKYEVSLNEHEDLSFFAFRSTKSSEIMEIPLKVKAGNSDFEPSFSIGAVENDKLKAIYSYNGKNYVFTMETALSNTIFSYLNREELENTCDWMDYYQVAIYAYKNKIDLEDSYDLAKKALKQNQNDYTIALSILYLESLGRNTEAQQLSALRE